MSTPQTYTMLCLGDSYTIGEAVSEQDRFTSQTAALLQADGINMAEPQIIAKTGWTTDELSLAINAAHLPGKYNFVTLLIGVNNQYRGRNEKEYALEFEALLNTAIAYAGGNKSHVFVISIPDWGVTPFAAKEGEKRSAQQIGREIDAFNAEAKAIAQKAGVHFIDITPGSRLAEKQPELLATDGLHPSALMYADWAEKLAEGIKKELN